MSGKKVAVLGSEDLQVMDGWLVVDSHVVDHHRAWLGPLGPLGAEQRTGPRLEVDPRETDLLLRAGCNG